MKKRKPLTEETKLKISIANKGVWVKFNCDYCGEENESQPSHFKLKKRHFCNMQCYSDFRKHILPMEEQHAYKGIRKEGQSKQVYHKNYCKKHPKRIAHLKSNRYARERSAIGSHTFEQWEDMKIEYNNKCAFCREEKKLTKDHIIPLSEGGTNYIDNIQPLCRNCNSKKWKHIHENKELLK
jgi:5-methylcytosine-specific restriction endonuclease McrA